MLIPFNQLYYKQEYGFRQFFYGIFGLTQGGPFPDTACDGRVYKKSFPGVVLRITGGSMIEATRYNLERYRCNLCLATYTASLPDDVSIKDKYDAKAKAVVVVDRIQLGVAMYLSLIHI